MPFIFYIFAVCYTGDFYLSHERRYGVTQQVSKYIKIHCHEHQNIYAFLYHNPSVYFLAKRRRAIPYLFRSKVLFAPEVLREIEEAIKQKKIDYLITYDLPYTLEIAKINCEYSANNFTKAIKACFSPDFSPFCKNYPIQHSLIKQIFKIIPKHYLPVKTIPFNLIVVLLSFGKNP